MAAAFTAPTEADLRQLMKGADPDARAAATHRFCRKLDRAVLSEEDRAAAQQILRLLATDTAELVRRALAVTLKASDLLPRETALRLARDVDAIALPVLNGSPVFTDEDLIQILKTAPSRRQVAIAERAAVSRRVGAAVAVFGGEEAVAAVCANDNAELAEAALQRAIDRFGQSDRVTRAIAYRAELPVAISERLVDLVSDAVRKHLVENHALKLETAMQLTSGVRERMTVDLVDQASVATDFAAFAQHLNKGRRLTASLLLRAVARGQMTFVEHGIAELAGLPHQRTWLMIHDAGDLGFRAVYDRAGLPARLFGAFQAGLDAWRSLLAEGGSMDRARFQERVLQRFLTQQPYAAREDVDYLLERLDRASEDLRTPAVANAA